MKISSFIKDQLTYIILSIVVWLIMWLFMVVIAVQKELIIVIGVLHFFLFFSNLGITFFKRYDYYNYLETNLEALDKKYLISELLPQASFLEGQILYDTLKEANKSMNDEANIYKLAQNEYKEYIELWIHEVKTPIAASKLLIHNHPSEVTQSIEEELDRIDQYLEQALFYARSQSVEKDYIIKQIQLQPLINQIIKQRSKTFILKKIKIELKNLEYMIYSDSKWLTFILNQIVDNALKYTPNIKGVISISAIALENSVVLQIQDNGPGISEKDLPRVFEKGYTGQLGRTHSKATGIGLYLCHKLCTQLHHDIRITSNQGCCVEIVFPKSNMMFVD